MHFSHISPRLITLAALPLIVASAPPPVVELGYATYQGLFNSSSNTTNFLGIRYAAAPIGKSFCILSRFGTGSNVI